MADTIDPDFLPFDVTADPQIERREMAHMLSFWRQGLHQKYRVSGLFSPKFTQKTSFDGKLFTSFIQNNPDYDVWFINPYPAAFYLSYNIWEQGECWHPGLCDRAAQVFAAANIALDPRNFPRSTKRSLLFSNFWAGTPYFWDQFMPFVDHISTHAEKIPAIFDRAFYVGQNVCYWPFLFERLFTTFLIMRPDIRVRYIKFEIPLILQMSRSKTQALMVREWAPLIDKWDIAGTYNEDQRATFRNLQKLEALSILDNHPTLQKIVLDL